MVKGEKGLRFVSEKAPPVECSSPAHPERRVSLSHSPNPSPRAGNLAGADVPRGRGNLRVRPEAALAGVRQKLCRRYTGEQASFPRMQDEKWNGFGQASLALSLTKQL